MAENQSLTPAERKRLLGQSHRLKAVAQVGRAGLTDALLEQVRQAFHNAELVKVRILGDHREEIQRIAEQLAEQTGAVLVKRIGKVAVLHKAFDAEHLD